MDFDGRGGYFRWTNAGWSDTLDLALEFGWEPAGTGPPQGCSKADWSGIYHGNQGQRVYARDAAALADALSRALIAIPTRRAVVRGKPVARFLPSADAEGLRQFIAYCRAGSFRIH